MDALELELHAAVDGLTSVLGVVSDAKNLMMVSAFGLVQVSGLLR